MLNSTDEAMLLFRILHDMSVDARYMPDQARAARIGRIKYRVWKRWTRRDAVVPGTIRPEGNSHPKSRAKASRLLLADTRQRCEV